MVSLNDGTYLLDCPGFDDTRGDMVKVANSIVIQKIIFSLKAFKVVFVTEENTLNENKTMEQHRIFLKLCKLFNCDDAFQLFEKYGKNFLIWVNKNNTKRNYMNGKTSKKFFEKMKNGILEKYLTNVEMLIANQRNKGLNYSQPKDERIESIKEKFEFLYLPDISSREVLLKQIRNMKWFEYKSSQKKEIIENMGFCCFFDSNDDAYFKNFIQNIKNVIIDSLG